LTNIILKKSTLENYEGIECNSFFEELNKKKYKIDYINKIVSFNNKKISYQKHFNTDIATQNAMNKITTSTILSKNNIPVPKFIEIDLSLSPIEIDKTIKKRGIKYPIVMKPIDGTYGRNVMTDIETIDELTDTCNYFLKRKYKSVILEEQIPGDCYRIFVFNNNVIDVIKREKPYIIGNGYDSINKLIEERNKEQIKLKLFETKNISKIVIKKQGYSLDDILPLNHKIFISNVINMHNGARISRIPLDKIPQKNIDLFIKVNKSIKITCSGLDYLSEDITIEYDQNNSKILEVNSRPDTEIHQKMKDFNFFERLTDSIF
jgi:glutathione synthase/RimK-type ligase-like ATP-grasp enzyme